MKERALRQIIPRLQLWLVFGQQEGVESLHAAFKINIDNHPAQVKK
jgi:hypothetical protein